MGKVLQYVLQLFATITSLQLISAFHNSKYLSRVYLLQSRHRYSKILLNASPSPSTTDLLETRRLQIREILSEILDPDTGKDIVTSKRVTDIETSADGKLSVSLSSKLAQSATFDQLKQFCILQLSMLDWVTDLTIIPKVIQSNIVASVENETKSAGHVIKNIIAVSSCKGGVGKSTVSVNLAYTLKQQGYKVGILDADIYGPSLPTMTRPSIPSNLVQGKNIIPLEYEGVQLMSMGFLSPGAAIMRGPMVNQILNQLVTLTAWGDLDYLIVDMPPGTGDIQLTLAQIMNISAAVIVTTPQRLSFVDVVKGIDMFDTVQVPCIAVVENMAEYDTFQIDEPFVSDTALKIAAEIRGKQHSQDELVSQIQDVLSTALYSRRKPFRLFGNGHLQRLRDMWGIEALVTLPLMEDVAQSGDHGRPYVLQYQTSKVAQRFEELALFCTKEIHRLEELQAKQGDRRLVYDPSSRSLQVTQQLDRQETRFIDSKSLRCACRCAVCVEEMTGKKLLKDETISETIQPLNMAPIGRYAWSIDWSDGHKSLYPWKLIHSLTSP